MTERPHIFIATPCFGGLVSQGYMQSILRLMQHAGSAGIDLSLGMLGHDALITRSRNTLLGRFLAVPAATHLLFIDADISFDPAMVERMARAGKDVAAGIYPLKALHWDAAAEARRSRGEAAETAAMLYVGTACEGAARETDDGFVTAVHAGTGFMMIRRGAITRMIAAYPETRYRTIHSHATGEAPAAEQYALFDCLIDPETGEYLSEDFAFCRRFRAIGGQIWLDLRGRLVHTGGWDFRGDPAARFG